MAGGIAIDIPMAAGNPTSRRYELVTEFKLQIVEIIFPAVSTQIRYARQLNAFAARRDHFDVAISTHCC